jgi:hypothetical protein
LNPFVSPRPRSYQFHRSEIEKTGLDVATFLLQKTDLLAQIDRFRGVEHGFCEKEISRIDLKALEIEVKQKFQSYGWYGFAYSNFIEDPKSLRTSEYGGLGITYDPYHWQKVENPHLHVLGDQRFNLGTVFSGPKGRALWDELVLRDLKNEFYHRVETEGLESGCRFLVLHHLMDSADVQTCEFNPSAAHQRGSHTYSDSLAFNRLTPAATTGYLGEILNSLKRTIARSRLVELKSTSKAELHWHTDENIFLCTRINIPIFSNVEQLLRTPQMGYEMRPGKYYCWNSGQPHKVEIQGVGSRTNLVLGISPWFDYDQQTEIWSSNEYYGTLHPQEMFQQNLLAAL